MRRSGIVLLVLTLAWVAACALLMGTWFVTGFNLEGTTIEQTRRQGYWGMWLASVIAAGVVVLFLASLALKRNRVAISFGVVGCLLLFPTLWLGKYSYKETRYQPCDTYSVLWDCPTDLD